MTRVVVTGMGWITPLGNDLNSVWKRMCNGESAIATIDRFDASSFPTKFAGQVRDFDWKQYVQDAAIHHEPAMNSQFALGAAKQAWEQSGLGSFEELDPERAGIYLGAGEGVLDFSAHSMIDTHSWDVEDGKVDAVAWAKFATEQLDEWGEVEQEPNMPLWHLAREYNLRGPAFNCLTACAASTQAIGEATSVLLHGDADVMLAGGTHTMLHALGITGFNRLTALSTFEGDPKKASKPFSRDRGGFVMGEGSGMLVLETLEHALARGATPLAEIVGFGSSADAYRITDLHPEGRGPSAAMNNALSQAGIDAKTPTEHPPVQYISAHGTSTQENDSIETMAIKLAFGANAPNVPISSIKSMMGHLIAAAGSVELITCIMSIQTNMLVPTINLDNPDPSLDLDYIPNTAREADVDCCLSNSFGFGGQNNTLVVKRFEV
ncbi:MAG: beta-ketoacyl-[acyl-carrier-protein] synthase family protein [Planctomycetes bacterium]|nr:beta-ketoacyl-[acyl-carrier-protein] synthase family protein [Planctomycetota bacterium]